MKKVALLVTVLVSLAQFCSADWLMGWHQRRKITIDNTYFGDNLTHYPLAVFLGTSVGKESDDLSDVFTEVGSSSNKIAVTQDDGITQLYVEVEQWDVANQQAILWVSSSGWTISSVAPTELYLYYDGSHGPNGAYVGKAGSRTEVWDSDFAMVWHLQENGTGTSREYKDSTSNARDGSGGSASGSSTKTPDQTDGKIGKGQDFNHLNQDQIRYYGSSFTVSGAFTFQIWLSTTGPANCDLGYGYLDNSTIYQSNGNVTWKAPNGKTVYGSPSGFANGNWHYLAQRRDSSDNLLVRYDLSTLDTETNGSGSKDWRYIGEGPYQGTTWPGNVDECRVSFTDRSIDWMNADYYSHSDSVLTWADSEVFSSGTLIIVR